MSEEIDLSGIKNKPIKKSENIDKNATKEVDIKEVDKMKRDIATLDKKDGSDKDEKILIDKRRLILILQFYVLEFPEELSAYKTIKYDKKMGEELEEIRTQMDAIISSKSSLKQTQVLCTTGIRAIEFVATNFTPIKCHGLSDLMINDREVLDDIKHIALKRMSYINTEPEFRLAYRLFSNVMLLHNLNASKELENPSGPAILNKINSKNIDNELDKINDKFTDL